MRVYHETTSGEIHGVFPKISLPFLVLDFGFSAKSIIPLSVSSGDGVVQEKTIFYCPDCEKEIPINKLFCTCCKCGNRFNSNELFILRSDGICACEKHITLFTKDKIGLKTLDYYISSIVSR